MKSSFFLLPRAALILAMCTAPAFGACRYYGEGHDDDDGFLDCDEEDNCTWVEGGEGEGEGEGEIAEGEGEIAEGEGEIAEGEGEIAEGEGEIAEGEAECADGCAPTEPPPVVDTDGDGLCDDDEATRGTDPTNPDSDGDGETDGDEQACGSSPLDPFFLCPAPPPPPDADADGLSDDDEALRGTDAQNADTDGDGESDGVEEACDSSPLDPFFTCASRPGAAGGGECPPAP